MTEVKSGGTISHWITAMNRYGFQEKAMVFSEDKLGDNKRLKESGLPTFPDFIVPLGEFSEQNQELIAFLSSHTDYVIRAIPNVLGLTRKFRIGVKSFADCLDFLSQTISPEEQNKYSIFLTGRGKEPITIAGVIISRKKDLIIEVAKGNLDELCHGRINPQSRGYLSELICSMNYSTKDTKERELMWNALRHIRDSGEFMKGYFEFVATEKGKVTFVDYKTNSAYLS